MKIPGASGELEIRIAAVEDRVGNIYSLRFILQSLGYEVLCVGPEEDAFEELLEFSPQLILVDMLIPDGASFRFLAKLAKSRRLKCPLVAITAAAIPLGEKELLKAGADHVLFKPFNVQELQVFLENCLKG